MCGLISCVFGLRYLFYFIFLVCVVFGGSLLSLGINLMLFVGACVSSCCIVLFGCVDVGELLGFRFTFFVLFLLF